MRKVYKFNLFYSILKPYVSYCFRFFYSSTTIEGRSNIALEHPYMLAPNHQNALMDALAVLLSNPSRTIFLARSDIFTDKKLARILHFLRIMPIYRIRDGRDELSKNKQVFDNSEEVLRSGSSLCLMPEGRQSLQRRLFPLVKGMFRIAFQTQLHMPDSDIHIIPMGIDYGDYVREGEHLIIRYGSPIKLSKHMRQYDATPAKALLELRSECYDGISGLTQNIVNAQYYNQIYGVSKYFCDDRTLGVGQVSKLEARRAISNAICDHIERGGSDFNSIANDIDGYEAVLKRVGCDDRAVRTKRGWTKLILMSLLSALLALPTLLAWLINFFQHFLPRIFTRKFKKKDFVSSVNFVGYLALNILIMITLLTISIFTSLPFWVGIVIFFIAPPARRLIYFHQHLNRKLVRSLKLSTSPKSDRNKLYDLRKQIQTALYTIID